MIKDVVISIRSLIDYGLAEEDSIDFTTDGVYQIEDGVAHIAYLETEVTGLQGTRTSVKVMGDSYSYTAVIRSITKGEDDGSAPLMGY